MSGYTGGPAFPISEEILRLPNPGHAMGMTLRDYFAAKAMLTFSSDSYTNVDWLAGKAYEIADAMLAERAK